MKKLVSLDTSVLTGPAPINFYLSIGSNLRDALWDAIANNLWDVLEERLWGRIWIKLRLETYG